MDSTSSRNESSEDELSFESGSGAEEEEEEEETEEEDEDESEEAPVDRRATWPLQRKVRQPDEVVEALPSTSRRSTMTSTSSYDYANSWEEAAEAGRDDHRSRASSLRSSHVDHSSRRGSYVDELSPSSSHVEGSRMTEKSPGRRTKAEQPRRRSTKPERSSMMKAEQPARRSIKAEQPPDRKRSSRQSLQQIEEEGAARCSQDAAAAKEQEEQLWMQAKEQEEQLWSSMSAADAKKMESMLQAASLYQQQLQQNENTIANLQDQAVSKERAYSSLRRHVQQLGHDIVAARAQCNHHDKEQERWASKWEQHDGKTIDMAGLHAKRGALQEQRSTLSKEVELSRAELAELQERLSTCQATGQEQVSRFQALEVSCREAIAALKAEQSDERTQLRERHEQELPRREAELKGRVSELCAQHTAEASSLRSALAEAQRHTGRLAREHQEALEHVAAQQREGSRLQQQYAEAREETLELASHVRAYQDVPRVASQLGISMDGSMASIEFLPLPGEDPELDLELEEVRRQCRALERECQRVHSALEKKHAECERWRKRSLRPGLPQEQEPAEGSVGEVAAPFVLGPGP